MGEQPTQSGGEIVTGVQREGFSSVTEPGRTEPASRRAGRWLEWPLALAVALGCGGAGSEAMVGPDGEGVLGEWVRADGLERTYELRLPASYDGEEAAPLLIALHGNPDDGAGFESRSGLTDHATQAGFVTVYPDGLERTWGPWDTTFTRILIEHLQENLAIDASRIYLTGYSAGGSATQMIVCAHSDKIAAAAPVGATLDREIFANCEPPRPIPILFVHGTADRAWPWGGVSSGGRRRFSMRETLDRWRFLNTCSELAMVDSLPDREDDGTRVWSERWTDCAGSAEVMLYGIQNGGHTWPSGPGPFPSDKITREISSVEILEFLSRHSLADADG